MGQIRLFENVYSLGHHKITYQDFSAKHTDLLENTLAHLFPNRHKCGIIFMQVILEKLKKGPVSGGVGWRLSNVSSEMKCKCL